MEFQPVIKGVPKRPVVFHDTLHVPALGSNLLSLFHLTREKGYKLSVDGDQVLFHHDQQLLFTATVTERNIGYLNGHTIVPQSANHASTCPLDLTLWHRRCSHLNFDDLRQMQNHNLVIGMTLDSKTPPDPICEPCIMGKQHRHNIPKTATRHNTLLSLIHNDLKGPLPVASLEGHKYWEPFVDDKSRFMVIAFLKQKSDAFPAFKQFKAFAENQVGRKIQATRDDKGGEFMGKEYIDYCAKEGIMQQHTEPNEPHQNGVAKILQLVQLHSWSRPSFHHPSGIWQCLPMCIPKTALPHLH